jgi:hypothetical protein
MLFERSVPYDGRSLMVDTHDRVAEATIRRTHTAVCDVMLKDMADSKRINDHIQGTAAQVC